MQAKSQEKGMAAGGGLISSLSIELKATKPSLSSLLNPKPPTQYHLSFLSL